MKCMRRIGLAFVFATLGFGLLAWFLRATHGTLLLGVLAALVFAGVAIAIASGALAIETRRLVVSPAPSALPVVRDPYRGALAVAQTPAARLSGRRVALVLALALLATACAVPLLLHRARWIEAESVLLAWWAIWALVVGLVVYRGHEAADDHELAIAFPMAGAGRQTAAAPRPPRRGWSLAGDVFAAASDGEAILVAMVLAIVLVLLFAGAWVILEVVFPCLFFIAYTALLRALRRSQGHAGSLRAAGIGIVWATAYTAPLAVVVWLVHVLAA